MQREECPPAWEAQIEAIDLDPALISRFDLMFMLSDEPDEEEDTAIAEHMIESRRAAVKRTHDDAGDGAGPPARVHRVCTPGSTPDDRGRGGGAEDH